MQGQHHQTPGLSITLRLLNKAVQLHHLMWQLEEEIGMRRRGHVFFPDYYHQTNPPDGLLFDFFSLSPLREGLWMTHMANGTAG